MNDAPHHAPSLSPPEPSRASASFPAALERLDPRLFDAIPSESSPEDRRSLLALQLATRELVGAYVYLEIGSHLGGSLQPHLLDPRCGAAYSIDLRSPSQPDARGVDFPYEGNSTARMLANLGRLSPDGVAKLRCFDGRAKDVPLEALAPRPNLCFVDAEHTDRAVVDDFAFCRKAAGAHGAVVFHDAAVVYNGLHEIVSSLAAASVPFRAYNLPDVLFVIELGDFPLHRHTAIEERLRDNHVGYLASLRANDGYRAFANRPVFRLLRGVRRLLGAPFRRR